MALTFLQILALACIMVSDTPLIKLMFDNEASCEFSVAKERVPYLTANEPDLFSKDQIKQILIRIRCSENDQSQISKGTGRIHSGGIVTLKYCNNYNDSVFFSIFNGGASINENHRYSRLLKAGRIFGLSRSDSTIQMFVLNACSDNRKFERIVKLLRQTKYYDKVIASPCGGDPRAIEIF